MTATDTLVHITLTVVLIVGGYQFYFWCQRHTNGRARSLSFDLDNRIRIRPGWVWIYSGLYYPAIGAVTLSARNAEHFNSMAFSYLVLLASHVALFLLFPVEVPLEWRDSVATGTSLSHRFLAFVQRLDARSNCFPSMHVSVATLTGLHIARNMPLLELAAVLFVVLIATSCVLTKQHYLVDLPPGLVLGWAAYRMFLAL